MSPKLQVWSCGGGTQSTAIAVLIIQGKLPKPDLCVIADTGRETRKTWEYLDQYTNPALAQVGLEVIRIPSARWSYHGIKIQYSKTTVAIPAYSTLNGPISKMPNFCTRNWKIDAILRWLSESLGVTKSKARMWLGFSREEPRAIKAMANEDHAKGLTWLPLVEHLAVTRRQAIQIVTDFGWPEPPRSACWMCPNHSDHEWRLLPPDELQKAIDFDRDLRVLDEDAFLHRSCLPLDKVDFSQPEDLFSRPCDSGNCFV